MTGLLALAVLLHLSVLFFTQLFPKDFELQQTEKQGFFSFCLLGGWRSGPQNSHFLSYFQQYI